MKIMIVVGARPNFMKAAPIINAIASHNGGPDSGATPIECILVHTGQHYDTLMSDAFFADLNMPAPDIFLGVGSGTHAAQTAEIMKRFEEVLVAKRPDIVVVVGDVNSTLACALVASKISAVDKPLLAHVEAGLRSFDRSMPEECNRIVTDHLSDLLFVSEESGLRNLSNEGIPAQRVFFVGNTMIDSLLAFGERAQRSKVLERIGVHTGRNGNGHGRHKAPYALLTIHRPANVDVRENFVEILEGLQELLSLQQVIFPAHPRTLRNIQQYGLNSYFETSPKHANGNGHGDCNKIKLIEPQGYLDFVCLMKNARLVITDSGGIQEETTCLGVPCVTVRENTERPVTVKLGTNLLAGVRRQGICRAIQEQLACGHQRSIPEKWDGNASKRIVEILVATARNRCPLSDIAVSKGR